MPQPANAVIDARDQPGTPGLVNTPRHMFQSPTRVVRLAQDCELIDWQRGLYPVWAG